jgi:hypothetical protein
LNEISPLVGSIISFIMKGRINKNRFLVGEAVPVVVDSTA